SRSREVTTGRTLKPWNVSCRGATTCRLFASPTPGKIRQLRSVLVMLLTEASKIRRLPGKSRVIQFRKDQRIPGTKRKITRVIKTLGNYERMLAEDPDIIEKLK